MALGTVSFDLGFYKIREKVTFVDFQQGEQGFWFFICIPIKKKLKIMNNFKTLTIVSMETSVVSIDSFLDKLLETFYWNGFWEG